MNKNEYVVDQKLLQDVLNYITSSTTSKPVIEVIQLVDSLRALKPFDPNTQRIPNEHLLRDKEEKDYKMPKSRKDIEGK